MLLLFFSRPNYVSSILKSGSKESQFYSLPFGQALASLYLPKSFQLPCKFFLEAGLITVLLLFLNSPKNFTCSLGKLRTEGTSTLAKSTSPGLSDSTVFAH